MKIAVIGAGISGLATAWLLSRHHEVELFESENRLGGHAHTVNVQEPDGNNIPMDSGFLVYNELTYPHLTRFFKALDVETVDSEMSLSVQVGPKNLEWAGKDLNTVFGQRRNLFKPQFYGMLFEILRFGREADQNLSLARRHAWTLADLLQQRKFSREFKEDYLLPIGAAIWSTPEPRMLSFPAATFLTFFINHKLLQVNNRPIWRTVKNGSIQYVQKARHDIGQVNLGAPVISVERMNGKVVVRTGKESTEFDRVVMATHAPVTAKILKLETELEQQVLTAVGYEKNQGFLHTDSSYMPRHKRCWSSWNVYGNYNQQNEKKVSLSYYLNRLQPLQTKQDYFLTLNPERNIQQVLQKFEYAHPQFDQAAIRAQRELPSIQGRGGVYFAGAWTRYGFHEDGILSAVNVAKLMNVEPPWTIS